MTIDERQAWLLFVGLVAASMGVSLAADATRQGDTVADWGGAAGGDDARRAMTRAYRLAGAAFVAAGLALSAAALLAPQAVAGRFHVFSFDDRGRLAGGVVCILLGSTWAAARWGRRPRALPGGLEGEALVRTNAAHRALQWAGWARPLLVTLYGCFLLSRIGGLPQ